MVATRLAAGNTTPRVLHEPLIPFGVLALALTVAGEVVGPNTLIRWATKGRFAANGSRIILEAIETPSGWYTSAEAVGRLREGINTNRGTPRCKPGAPCECGSTDTFWYASPGEEPELICMSCLTK